MGAMRADGFSFPSSRYHAAVSASPTARSIAAVTSSCSRSRSADEPGCAGQNDTSGHVSIFWEILEVVQRRAPDSSARWVIRLLTMLQQAGRIDEELIRKLLGWRHSGFSVQNEVRVGSRDVAGRRRVAESILRSPFSQERTRPPREKPAYPLTPTHPITGETDWILTVVELPKVISDPG